MSSFKKAFQDIKSLSRKFEERYSYFTNPLYSELSARKDFIDCFFQSLGWDIDLLTRQKPSLQEVRLGNLQNEQFPTIQKVAEYAFYLKTNSKSPQFFVEAKKPALELGTRDNYFQTIRYGWNARLKIAVITNFKELHILDCRLEPDFNNESGINHALFKFTDYQDEKIFKKIYGILSYENVLKGSIDSYIESIPKPGGKTGKLSPNYYKSHAVDRILHQFVDETAKKLAMVFGENAVSPDPGEVQNNIQRTIDRLLFMRFLEDSTIEPSFSVGAFANSNLAWKDFIQSSRSLGIKYTGTVFGKQGIDEIRLGQKGEEIFKKICHEFSFSNSKFLFNQLRISVLGSIYERSIGKIPTSAAGGYKNKTEPATRKTGGVYYTPEFIIDFMLDHAIGKLISGKSPVEIAKYKIADISCGCGSFLLGIANRLFDYHTIYYNKHPQYAEGEKCNHINGRFVLSRMQKLKIVINNIYGVDIDPEAVGICRSSLFLLIMEDELIPGEGQHVLPTPDEILSGLCKNIVCNNSLFGPGFNESLDGELGQFNKTDPGKFAVTFPELEDTGFDAIVGNPPYGAGLSKNERKILLREFPYGNSDTAALFLHRADQLLRKGGLAAFIIPKAFSHASNWKKTRDYFLADLCTIADCSKVWKEVKLEMCIIISEKGSATVHIDSYSRNKNHFLPKGKIFKENCRYFDFIINAVDEVEIDIARKMKSTGSVLNDYVINQRGGMFQNQIGGDGEFKAIGGKQIKRYGILNKFKGYVKKTGLREKKCSIQSDAILVQNIVAHIKKPTPRIAIIATIPDRISNIAILDTINQLKNCGSLSSQFILGVLNSKIIGWYTHKFIFANSVRTMHFDSITTKKIPFPNIDLKNPDQLALHENIAGLVSQRLEMESVIARSNSKGEIAGLENRNNSIENSIDNLVCLLFGLNAEDLDFLF